MKNEKWKMSYAAALAFVIHFAFFILPFSLPMDAPPINPQYAAPNNDAEHLRLLSMFHYVMSAIAAFFGCVPVVHLLMGIAMATGMLPEFKMGPPGGNAQPGDAETARMFGIVIAVFAGVMILIGWTMAVMIFLVGRNLAARRRRTFCIVIAALECMATPFGTVLGVFTIIVLVRPSVQALFDVPRDPREF